MKTIVRQMRESQMSPLICQWLNGLGFKDYCEVPMPCSNSRIDHVGINWETKDVVCVEMKTNGTRNVFYQAYTRQLITKETYIAIRSNPKSSTVAKARADGIGLLRVTDKVEIIVAPNKTSPRSERYHGLIIDHCQTIESGGIGGLPQLKGDGPAIRVAAAIRKYREMNPTANWKQIFSDVPNHYAHFRSLQGAMRWHNTNPDQEVKNEND
jgi:hypothetical protein